MLNKLKLSLAAFFAGLIFATGLGISGMTQPEKVIGFLRIGPTWDPSLAFVMMGAILVFGASYHVWLKKLPKPAFAPAFSIPSPKNIDRQLIGGAVLFGIGWGWSGFCPGPALFSVASLDQSVLIFVLAMIAGMSLFHFYQRIKEQDGAISKGKVSGKGIVRDNGRF